MQEAVAVLARHLFRQGDHVGALVMVALQRRVLGKALEVAPIEGFGEGAHLRPGVVHVVFALDRVTRRRHDIRQRVAEHGIARRAHVQRPGRVGADELHLAALALAQVDVTIMAGRLLDFEHLAGQPAVAQAEIDEAGRDNLDRLPMKSPVGMCLAMAWAMASGAILAALAHCMATEVA